jgi:hypothetical protein
LRFDERPVAIETGNERIPTELRKSDAILAEYAQVGFNSVLFPEYSWEKLHCSNRNNLSRIFRGAKACISQREEHYRNEEIVAKYVLSSGMQWQS